MKNIIPFFACFAVVCIISCKNKQDQPGTTNTSNQEYVLPSTLNNQQQGNSSSGTNNEKIDMQPVKTDQLTTNTSNANVKLNPAHGEPGHRCDIAVGAPLDGSVQPTTTNVQPVTVNTQPTAKTTTNSNAKLNPAHGQPGHRCDIAVGAPLDGSVQQTTNVQPVTVNTQPATNTTSNSNVKLNPAHGQPGHRCDIAVGAPLDGSTATKTNAQTTSNSKSPLQYFPTVNKVDPNASKTISVDAVKKDSSKN